MATDFGSLKTEVAAELDRADLASRIPTWINDGMQRVNRELTAFGGIIDQEQVAQAATIASQDSLAVPTDYEVLRFIKIGTDLLEVLTYEQLLDIYEDRSGTPQACAIFDGSFYMRPIPDGVYTVKIGYAKRYAQFVNDTDTNWLVTNGASILVYAACLAATPQLREDPRVNLWLNAYRESLRIIHEADRRSKRGPKQAGVQVDPLLLNLPSNSSILTG